MLKGYRTTIFAGLLVMFGALQMALPELQKSIPPEMYPYIFMVVGGVVQVLRMLTDTSIFAKGYFDRPKNLQALMVAAAMSVTALVGALFPTPAKAAIEHVDGSFTLSREEAEEVLKALKYGEIALHELIKMSEPKGCT